LELSEIGEFGFIDRVRQVCDVSVRGVIKGIGDDCAVFRASSGSLMLFTTDMLLEDIHFMRDTITSYQLGRKVIAVNLSDIAAMGGRPLVALISLGIPIQTEVEEILELYRGMRDICTGYGLNIAGGDTVASSDKLVINASVIGEGRENEILYRSGANPGDKVYLTGHIGDSIAGLKILKNEITPPGGTGGYFINAHNEPKPLVEIGAFIATSGLATAMIDLSDGLLSDLGHICEESGVGATISAPAIPLSPELKLLAGGVGFNSLELALSGGEDYQLLFTAPEKKAQRVEKLFRGHGISPPSLIGEIVQERGIRLRKHDGSSEELRPKGFNHFSQSP
jgi:thiamine-monophosphate kinase